MGALRLPDGRILFGTGRLFRHEDRDLRFGAYGQRRAPVARPRPEGRIPQRRGDGAGRSGAGPARHFVLVRHPRIFRRCHRTAETRRHHDHHADLRHGRFDAGALRARRRRHLYQGGRRGRRPRGQGRGGNSRRRPAQSRDHRRQCGRQRGRRGRHGRRPLRKLLRLDTRHRGSRSRRLRFGGRDGHAAARRAGADADRCRGHRAFDHRHLPRAHQGGRHDARTAPFAGCGRQFQFAADRRRDVRTPTSRRRRSPEAHRRDPPP